MMVVRILVVLSVVSGEVNKLGEVCDDGNTADGDTCSSSCTSTPLVDPSHLFISTWDTRNISSGSSADNQIKLPLVWGNGFYNFDVDWGDGQSSTVTSWNDADRIHTYVIPGEYVVRIDGQISGFRFNNTGDKYKILDISQWGSLDLRNKTASFYGCIYLHSSATDSPYLDATTNLAKTFLQAVNFNGDLSSWNVSNVVNMSTMFSHAHAFQF